MPNTLDDRVGIFFVADGEILLHTCSLAEAKAKDGPKDGLLIYPESHEQVWTRRHVENYGVEYDYFPRGRIVYVREHDYFVLYHNECSRQAALEIHSRYRTKRCQLAYDLSYRCHQCRSKRSSVWQRLRRRS